VSQDMSHDSHSLHFEILPLTPRISTGLGPYLYGYTPNGEDDIFAHRGLPISLSDPAAFHANMLMASISMDRISGHSLSGVRALRHRIEAIRLINEKLADPADCVSAGTIYTVTVLTCLEHNWGAVGSHEGLSSF
jgi:hypothetical protein